MKKIILTTTALSFVGFSAVQTWAQSSVSIDTTATATQITPLTLTKATDMHFGNIVVANPAFSTTVFLKPNATATGFYAPGGGNFQAYGAAQQTANFNVTGGANQAYNVTLPAGTVILSNAANTEKAFVWPNNFVTYTVNTAAEDQTGILSAGGTDQLRVGAAMVLESTPTYGLYSTSNPGGTGPYTVTVSYP